MERWSLKGALTCCIYECRNGAVAFAGPTGYMCFVASAALTAIVPSSMRLVNC